MYLVELYHSYLIYEKRYNQHDVFTRISKTRNNRLPFYSTVNMVDEYEVGKFSSPTTLQPVILLSFSEAILQARVEKRNKRGIWVSLH